MGTTTTAQAQQQALAQAQQALAEVEGGPLTDLSNAAGALTSPVSSAVGSAVTSALSPLVQSLGRTLLYVLFVGAGLALIIYGIARLTGAGRLIASAPIPIPA